ncbi:MAG: class I SAM-dependent methyltransferase [Leptospiraceae bacterium]|nr:class I SAM-dependent methyltransferase [Leptospiraceae bacterium]MDW8305849.1 class I SAM-dependent methyltransferase [Leptospiraceae bacterium]
MCQLHNHKAWRLHYTKTKARLVYPDETVVRYFSKYRSYFPKPLVLDLGCGFGRHLDFLRGEEIPCVGLDYAFEPLIGRQNVIQATACSLPFRDAVFDVVLSWGVIHYLKEEEVSVFLREVHRVLKKKGVFLLTVRSDVDTHLQKTVEKDLAGACVTTYSRKEAEKTLRPLFATLRYGFLLRMPLGEEEVVAHHVFEAIK